MLQTGSISGSAWKLTVFSSGDGDLCMGVNEDLVVKSTLRDTDFVEGGCGFGPDDDGQSSAIDVATAYGKGALYWGPAPPGAVVARLDSQAVTAVSPTDPNAIDVPGCALPNPPHVWIRITHRLPHWTKPGGWFIVHTPEQNGCLYFDARFFDHRGHRVPEPHW